MNHQKEASFSLGSYRGYSLYIYVYIHFQYFPAEKLIVHVNGYSFRLSTKVCKENHSSQKREYPLIFTNFEAKLHLNASLLAAIVLNPRGLKVLQKDNTKTCTCFRNFPIGKSYRRYIYLFTSLRLQKDNTSQYVKERKN